MSLSKQVIFGFLFLSLLLISLSGCSKSKQMCFCRSFEGSTFNHWIFVPDSNCGGGNITKFFLFSGNEQACHKACNNVSEKFLPETKLSYEEPYFGIESKLVPVSDDDLKNFILASGLKSIYLIAAAGQPVECSRAVNDTYSNLESDPQNAALLRILSNPKFAFLNRSTFYCAFPSEVCSWNTFSGEGSASDFEILVSKNSPKVILPDDYECSAPNATTLVVNDRFCWMTNPKEDPPICPNVKNPRKDVPLYGCLCVKSKEDVYDLTRDQIKSMIITRGSSYCCNNGQKVSCK